MTNCMRGNSPRGLTARGQGRFAEQGRLGMGLRPEDAEPLEVARPHAQGADDVGDAHLHHAAAHDGREELLSQELVFLSRQAIDGAAYIGTYIQYLSNFMTHPATRRRQRT